MIYTCVYTCIYIYLPQYIITIDSFSFFLLTLLAGFTRDEGDELGHALLDAFFGVFGDLGITRKNSLHDSRDVCNWQKP